MSWSSRDFPGGRPRTVVSGNGEKLRTCRKSLQPIEFVIPAKAGIQVHRGFWTPAFAGVTSQRLLFGHPLTRTSRFHPAIPALFLLGLFGILFFNGAARAEEIYRHKRTWPMLQNPWYFREPSAVAVSPSGYVYVVDKENHRVHKFTMDGQFVARWGSEGEGDGQFQSPQGIAVGPDGSVYVTDNEGFEVQKFTADGQFVTRWPETRDLRIPEGIAVDALGNVYVVARGDCQIYKFSSNGRFIRKWGGKGEGPGKFSWPKGITIGPAGHLYVTDTFSISVQKFTLGGKFLRGWNGGMTSPSGIVAGKDGNLYVTDDYWVYLFSPTGKFIKRWGNPGGKDGEFWNACGIAADPWDNIYVTDGASNGATHRVQKFTSGGDFITKWESRGGGRGQFWSPGGMAFDAQRNIYVVDKDNCRIQKFSPLGKFVTQWSRCGSKYGRFVWPAGIVVDREGYVYVTDRGIQKFSSTGQYITTFGNSGEGQLTSPQGIALDADGSFYVADLDFVMKFSSEGQFLKRLEVDDWQFGSLDGIAVDVGGHVYVSSRYSNLIFKFTSEGEYLGKWGGWGSAPGNLDGAKGLAVDADGNVYVADSGNHRIQKFTHDGEFISRLGQFGSEPGQLNEPEGVVVAPNGNVYVADTGNNRISVFEPAAQPRNIKAIVLAGGGPYPGNNLWTATQMVSNLAFRSLRYQGFLKDQVRYLTSDTHQDLDDNGEFDDLFPATKEELKTSITEWAADAEQLLICLMDHGGQRTFAINGTDGDDGMLHAQELASWLEDHPAREIVVIIDACFSGSFIEPLAGQGRVVITSTAPEEKAMYGESGSLSFSNFFWAQVFNGANFFKAFQTAGRIVSLQGKDSNAPQTPLVNCGVGHEANEPKDLDDLSSLQLVNETRSYNKPPVIGDCAATPNPIPQGSNSATLRADGVTDADGVQRVWAVLWPPDFKPEGSNPITQMPSVNLDRVSGEPNAYQATYNGFAAKGAYTVLFYAMDRQGNVSAPQLRQVTAADPLTHKAILVAGGTGSEPWFSAVRYAARLAYWSLWAQSYAPEDIRVFSPPRLYGKVPRYGEARVEGVKGLRESIRNWAAGGTQDLVLYLVGMGENGAFLLGQDQKLHARELATWLAELEPTLPGKIIVVYDGCRSGSFIQELQSRSGKRIVMASAGADQMACLANGGVSSFSQFFWLQVLNGRNLRDAFNEAQDMIYQIGKGQVAQLDADGNGQANTGLDKQLAAVCRIGPGFSLGSDPPVIQKACPDMTLADRNFATIWVEDVTTTGTLEKVWAVVVPPDYEPGSSTTPGTDFLLRELKLQGSGRYERVIGFAVPGRYVVAVFARDAEGNVSQPKIIQVSRN